MRIQRLDLIRYGHFTDTSVEFRSGTKDFHIIYGPNEAGKSTAHSAITDLLFGIPGRSLLNFLHENKAMRIGAILENGSDTIELIRRKGTRNTVLDAQENPLTNGDSALASFLAGADLEFFERMFGLDHSRLEEGGRAILNADDDVGEMLFSAGAGIGSLRSRLEALEAEADQLWAKRKSKDRRFYQALEALEDAKRELRDRTLTAARWRELKKAVEDAKETYQTVDTENRRLTAESAKLARIRRVYRNVRRTIEIEKEIEELGDVIELPEDALATLESALEIEREKTIRIGTLEQRLESAKAEGEDLEYDEQLLARGTEIKSLEEDRIGISREQSDLPKRKAELAQTEKELCGLAKELGWRDEGAEAVIDRIPGQPAVAAVRTLLEERSGLKANLETRQEALQIISRKKREIQTDLSDATSPKDTSRLAAILKTIREQGEISAEIQNAELRSREANEKINLLMPTMRPKVDDADALVRLPVPALSVVHAERGQLAALSDEIKDLDRQTSKLERSAEALDRELSRSEQEENLVTEEQLAEARKRRDQLWQIVRGKYVPGADIPEPLANLYPDEKDAPEIAFEATLSITDEMADGMFEKAEAVGRLREVSRQIDGLREEAVTTANMRKQKLADLAAVEENWRALWEAASIRPEAPDAMLHWIETRNEIVTELERKTETDQKLDLLRETVSELKEHLLTEIGALGEDRTRLTEDSLLTVQEFAEDLFARITTAAREAKDLQEALETAEREHDRCQEALTRAEIAWAEWGDRWQTALGEASLDASSAVEAVSTQIGLIGDMRQKAERINNLRHERIAKIERDVEAFEKRVSEMASDVAPDLSGETADRAILNINQRLDESIRHKALADSKAKETDDLTEEIRLAKEEITQTLGTLDHLKAAANRDSLEALREAIGRSDDLRSLRQELEDFQQLIEEDGDGKSVDEIVAECEGADPDQIEAEEASIKGELGHLRERHEEAVLGRNQAVDEFSAAGGDDAAAIAGAAKEKALAEMTDIATRYIRVRSASILLRWAIDRYRQSKQGPLLERAGKLFSSITHGSFEGLRVEYDDRDEPQLRGMRAEGGLVPVSGMSSGSADQLYLALRLAALEDYLERAESLPFLADDLFVNFDDERAGAGLTALHDLSERTQVLFFTHHRHLVEIATQKLGSDVHVLEIAP